MKLKHFTVTVKMIESRNKIYCKNDRKYSVKIIESRNKIHCFINRILLMSNEIIK